MHTEIIVYIYSGDQGCSRRQSCGRDSRDEGAWLYMNGSTGGSGRLSRVPSHTLLPEEEPHEKHKKKHKKTDLLLRPN
jgi:hypothetical protein